MKTSVFVNSIIKNNSEIVVEASNGGDKGPPFIRFTLPLNRATTCKIGSRFDITIEETR